MEFYDLIFKIFVNLTCLNYINGFLFDDMASSLGCSGVNLMCPPMCLSRDLRGCVTCNCQRFDPSHPGTSSAISGSSGDPSHPGVSSAISTSGGDPSRPLIHSSGTNDPSHPAVQVGGGSDPSRPKGSVSGDPSNPLSAPNSLPGSSKCKQQWTTCACAIYRHPTSGCPVCPCESSTPGNTRMTSQMTSPYPTTTSAAVLAKSTSPSTATQTTQLTLPTPIHNAMTSKSPSHVTLSSSPISTSSTVPITSLTPLTVVSAVSTRAPVPTLPGSPVTSSKAPFVCPGVFSCSLDCYAGFMMDADGCPLCQCAPIPTDLP